MRGPRLARFAVLVCAAAVVLALTGFAGAALCSLPSLPGDELWNLRREALEAFAAVFGTASLCESGSAAGGALSRLASWSPWLLFAALLAVLLWETLGRHARLALWRMRGGHAILLGSAAGLARLAARERREGPLCFLATDTAAAAALARAHPFAALFTIADGATLPGLLARIGAGKARFIAAASEADYANTDLITAVLALPSLAAKEMLLRLEDPDTRAEFVSPLRRRARQRGVALAAVSLTRGQLRDGARAGLPRRVPQPGQPLRFAVIGSGPLLQAIAFHLARQGYGLEVAVPELSIIRTGHQDFTSGALERLTAASDAVSVRASFADGANAAMLDRAIAAIAMGAPLAAIHCAEIDAPRALARALRVEAMLTRLNKPVPPIVAYCDGPAKAGETGMIACVPAGDIATAFAAARQRDAHAIALHRAFLDEQRRLRGEAFGSETAQVEWDQLPDNLQDDNAAVADHIAYKLQRIGHAIAEGPGAAAPLRDADIETLSRIEHARWMAAKLVEGWRHGAVRDNTAMLHPSLIPFDDLSAEERRKDGLIVAQLPNQLAAAGLSAVPLPDHARQESANAGPSA